MIPDEPVYALFSGGKDSFATAKVLQEADKLRGVVMIDTGISVPEWKSTCIDICEQFKMPYQIIPTNIRYEWFVWKYGFPGDTGHMYAMNYLKGRAIREYKKMYPNIALASGVRLAESARRALTTKELGTFETVPVHAPIFDWTTERVWAYVRSFGYERPRSYVTLGTSGDCLCGAYAREDERETVQTLYPDIAKRIRVLEEVCQDRHPTRCRWGWSALSNSDRATQSASEMLICQECSGR